MFNLLLVSLLLMQLTVLVPNDQWTPFAKVSADVERAFRDHNISADIVGSFFEVPMKEWGTPVHWVEFDAGVWFHRSRNVYRQVRIADRALNAPLPMTRNEGSEFRSARDRHVYILREPWCRDTFVPSLGTVEFRCAEGNYATSSQTVLSETVGLMVAAQTRGNMSFSVETLEVLQGRMGSVGLRISYTGPIPLAGVQVDVFGADSLSAGPGLPAGFNLHVARIEGGLRAIVLSLTAGLAAGTHDLLTVHTTAGLSTGTGIGSEATNEGGTAFLTAAPPLSVVIVPIGDVNRDRKTNLADFVATVDIALGRNPFHAAGDLYPYPTGDGTIDVRDMNVLGRAILAGVWPDGLPVLDGSMRQMSAAAMASVILRATKLEDGIHLSVDDGRAVMLRGAVAKAVAGVSAILSEDGGIYFSDGRLPSPFGILPSGTDVTTISAQVALDGTTVLDAIVEYHVSTEPGPQLSALSVYPTVTRGPIRLRAASAREIVIYDLIGRRVRTVHRHVVDGPVDVSVDIGDLASGTYVVVSISGDERHIIRITKL